MIDVQTVGADRVHGVKQYREYDLQGKIPLVDVSVVDTLLAVTARVHELTLVTRNVRDVQWTGCHA